MQAAYIERYGPPEAIIVRDVPRPEVGEHDVLVRMHASSVSPADCAMRSGDPFMIRFFTGLLRPRESVPGGAVAGIIEAVGAAVTLFQPGDRVFGTTDPAPGAMAEYALVPQSGALVRLPNGVDFGEAAGLTYSFLTAMPFLRDEAKLTPGMSILINGAAGSIGTVAIQLAKQMGATVTAVCSTRNAELVRSLGADFVIDRTKMDFTEASAAYDVIFDAVGKSSFRHARKALKPGGIYLTTVPSIAILVPMLRGADTEGKRGKLATTGLRPTPDKVKDMAVLQGYVAAGQLRGVIDRTYPLAAIAEAHRYVETGTKAGDVIISIA
jgi:NADPH:quinone reductase-like Zn-dependent oxidoreductase